MNPSATPDRAAAFLAMHRPGAGFILPNAWDGGSARILEQAGFAAIATTSAGIAFSRGAADGTMEGPEMLDCIARIVSAVACPVSADLESGYGATADAHHLTAPHPVGEGAAAAIRRALEDAGAEPADIVYVNAHGTSTPLNDRAETLALKAALGEHARAIPISSTKSAIGHLLGAGGAVEAIATILALRARVVPPTLGWEERDPDLDLDYVPGRARALELRDGQRPVAISNSFGFGGHNSVLCLEAI